MKSIKLLSLLLSCSLIIQLSAEDLSALPENGWESSTSRVANNGGSTSRNRQTKQPNQTQVKQRDLFLIDGGAVYLKPYQGGTDFAQRVDTEDLTKDQVPYGTNKGLDFNYDWGFRTGIGYQGGQSRQTLKATYMYLASNASKSTTSDYDGDALTSTSAIITQLATSGQGSGFAGVFTSAKSKWNLHFNMLDLAFGKKYPKRGCMTFEPFVGLKGIMLSENQKNSYTLFDGMSDTTTTGQLKQKNDFKGIGPMGGLSLDWALSKWISFIGSIDAALLYSSVKTKRSSDSEWGSILWIGSSHDIKGTPVLEGMFALKGVYCWKSGRFIDLKIGFEEHYIFETMKHTVLNSDSSTDFSLMGWFVTAGFGF